MLIAGPAAKVRDYREQVANVAGGRTWLVNAGTVAGLAAPATWALGDLAEMRFEVFSMAA